MKFSGTALIGVSIENPGNAVAMMHAAAMYGVRCCFLDTKGLARSKIIARSGTFSVIDGETVRTRYQRRIAFENDPQAVDVYGFTPGEETAIMVGNERRGLSYEFMKMATDTVQIPMVSRRVNCLNVAAASAVALYYMTHAKTGPQAIRANPGLRRPEILIIGGDDPIELGIVIRSAAAFGWERALVEDRGGCWFGCDRIMRSEGRAAARRGKNSIRLLRCPPGSAYNYDQVVVVTTNGRGEPLHRTRLADGGRQAVVLADERFVDLAEEDWQRVGKTVRHASLQVDCDPSAYHFRLSASVVLAEVARQVGRQAPGKRLGRRGVPIYDRALAPAADQEGQVIYLEDLVDF